MLPPSLASTYCGGVSVKVGGAVTQRNNVKIPYLLPEINLGITRQVNS